MGKCRIVSLRLQDSALVDCCGGVGIGRWWLEKMIEPEMMEP